jgi:hypothetical protein
MSNYSDKTQKDQIFYNQRGKVIGRLVGKTLQKKVKGSVHQLRKPPSWAWDELVLEQAERLGGNQSEVTDIETGKKYIAKLSLFHVHGIQINRGHGRQIALPIAYWSTDEEDNLQIRLF